MRPAASTSSKRGFGTGFADERAALRQTLRGVHLGLGALIFEDHLEFARHLDRGPARIGLRFGEDEQEIAVRQDAAVAGLGRVLPGDLAVGVEDLRGTAEPEERALGRRLGREGGERSQEQEKAGAQHGDVVNLACLFGRDSQFSEGGLDSRVVSGRGRGIVRSSPSP